MHAQSSLILGSLWSRIDDPSLLKGHLQMTALELLGVTIRTHRKRLSLTQKQLAAQTRLGYTYISDIERGTCNPSVRSLLRIAAALHLPASQLFAPLDGRPELYDFE